MALTLTVNEILQDVLGAIKVQFPMFRRMGTDFRPTSLKLNKVYDARIAALPTASTYDATDGYQKSAVDARTLMTDIAITVDQHPTVPLQFKHLDQIKDDVREYAQVIQGAGYVLGRAMLLNIAAKFVAANASQTSTFTTANSDYDMLDNIRGDMNTIGASPLNRVGIVNTAVASTLGLDERIASRDYRGDLQDENAFRVFRNVAGFAEVWEWPELPANAENLTGFFFEPRGVSILAGIPEGFDDNVTGFDAPPTATTTIETDTESGLTLGAVAAQAGNTLDRFLTFTHVFGSSVGKAGGSTGTLTDYACHRLVSA